MIELADTVDSLLRHASKCTLAPMYEGNNVCAWIGFKHINYLVEHAVLNHLKRHGLSSRRLYEEFGLGVDVVDIDTRILNSVHLDDELTAIVTPRENTKGQWVFRVVLSADGGSKDVTATVAVALRRDTYIDDTNSVPPALDPFAVDEIENESPKGMGSSVSADAIEPDDFGRSLAAGPNGISWSARIGYPYCHYNERMAMSGYLRLLEEAKDRFVADRGISVKSLLDTNRWIPAVPHSRITMLAEAQMEETVFVAYNVDEIFKDLTYRARFDCFVLRESIPVRTAVGTIVHGYAQIHRRDQWSLVNFDERVLAALSNA